MPGTIQGVSVVFAMVMVWYCFAALIELVASTLITLSVWPWTLRSFAADAKLDQGNHTWDGCRFYFTSIHGSTSGIGSNSRMFEVGVTEDGLALRVPMYASLFMRCWRWSFSTWLFPPCLISWRMIRDLTQNECIVQTQDPTWPVMRITMNDEMLKKVETRMVAAGWHDQRG